MDLQVFFDIAVLNESRCLSRVSGFWLYEPEISIIDFQFSCHVLLSNGLQLSVGN